MSCNGSNCTKCAEMNYKVAKEALEAIKVEEEIKQRLRNPTERKKILRAMKEKPVVVIQSFRDAYECASEE